MVSPAARGFRLLAVLAASLLAAARADAGGAARPLRLGERAYAELRPGERVDIPLDALAGATLSIECRAWRGDDLLPVVALSDPDGATVDLEPSAKRHAGGTRVSFRGVRLEKSGTYRLLVEGDLGTAGGFDVVLGGKYPAAFAGTATVAASDAEAPAAFEGLAADAALIRTKPDRGSPLLPQVKRFEDAGGTSAEGSGRRTALARVVTTGSHRFVVRGESSTTGDFAWSVRLRRDRPRRAWRDLADFIRQGSVSGTLLVAGGSAVQDAASAAAKRWASVAGHAARRDPVRAGELVVSLPGAGSREDAGRRLAAAMPDDSFDVFASLTDTGPYLVRVASIDRGGSTRDQGRTRSLAKAARRATGVAWAEANCVLGAAREPNDARWPAQDDFVAMGLPEAWDTTTGSPSVVVAVVDSGIWTHPDLATPLPGYDFVQSPSSSMDGDGPDADPTDAAHVFHGTHVAGTIAALANNRSGVAGVLWNARILPVRVLGKSGGGTAFDIAAGIRWAAGLAVSGAPTNANPARVVNLSLGGGAAKVVEDAVAAAIAAGSVVVAAAGNSATSSPTYPAAYPGVVSVAAVAPDLRFASYSNYGSWISVCAPGGDSNRGLAGILSTYVDPVTLAPTYTELQGTSMATPHVAGVAALLLSAQPTLTPAEVKSTLETTAHDLGSAGFDPRYGWGLVDAASAVQAVSGALPGNRVSIAPAEVHLPPGTDAILVYVRNVGTSAATLDGVTVSTNSGLPWLSATASGSTLPATIDVRVDRGALAQGVHDGAVVLQLSTGAVAVPVHVVASAPTDPGPVLVAALDGSGTTVASTVATLAGGFAYTLEGLPPGDYTIVAYADKDGDGVVARVDEWFGRWPLVSDTRTITLSPGAMHPTGIDFTLKRRDADFDFDGAGGGKIAGAAAVRVLDDLTRLPIPGARVYLADGMRTLATDASGRALFVDGVVGPQTITVAADGYDMQTTFDCDAQYQSFALGPRAPARTDVTVTVGGLGAADRSILVQVGSQSDVLSYGGSGPAPSTTLSVARGTRPIPVWALVYDATGAPAKVDLVSLDPSDLGSTASVALNAHAPFAPARSHRNLTIRRPASGMDVVSTGLTVAELLYFTDAHSLLIGIDGFTNDVASTARWVSFGPQDPESAATIVAAAQDDFGRESRALFNGTVDTLTLPSIVALAPPPVLASPAPGASGVPAAAVLTFASTTGFALTQVEVIDPSSGARWLLNVPADRTSVTLPTIPDGLVAGRTYDWRVLCYDIPGFDYDDYSDGALTTSLVGFTSSEARVFTVR